MLLLAFEAHLKTSAFDNSTDSNYSSDNSHSTVKIQLLWWL